MYIGLIFVTRDQNVTRRTAITMVRKPDTLPNNNITRRSLIGGYLTATALSLVGCSPAQTSAEQSPAASAPSTPGAGEASQDVPKPLSLKYEQDPTTTSYYETLSDADKKLFKERWAPISKKTYSGPIADRLRMATIVSGIYDEMITNVSPDHQDVSEIEVSYEAVKENPNLAVDSVNKQLGIAYFLNEQAGLTARYHNEINTPLDERPENTLLAYQHILAGIVGELIPEDKTNTNRRPDAPIILFAKELIKSLSDYRDYVGRNGIPPQTMKSKYMVHNVYTDTVPDGMISYYVQRDITKPYGVGGRQDIDKLTYNVIRDNNGPIQSEDRFGNSGLEIAAVRSKDGKPSGWYIENVSKDPYTITPAGE